MERRLEPRVEIETDWREPDTDMLIAPDTEPPSCKDTLLGVERPNAVPCTP